MRRASIATVCALLALAAVAAATAAPPPGKGQGKGQERANTRDETSAVTAAFSSLNPGNNAGDLAETVNVNVVFVGYEAADVAWATVEAELPETSKPVVRSRLLYEMKEPLGITYTYTYNPVYAGAAFENAYFAYLSSIAKPQSTIDPTKVERTLFQDQYNAQQNNALEVGTNYFVDAPSAEQKLAELLPSIGVDPETPTVVFVNWWGRDDFKFHTYTKLDEPDPDTNYNFGLNRQTRKMIAWGGTAADDEENGFGVDSRLWFHDLSAGPESWTDNWNVDDADVDGDDEADYRLPPVWEYEDGEYAHPGFGGEATLAGDLGKIVRYVAINLLFTASPLYPPYHNENLVPDAVELDVNTVQGWSRVDADQAFRTQDLLMDETRELLPWKDYSLEESDVALAGDVKECYYKFVVNARCYNDRTQYPAFGNLFLNAALGIDGYKEGDAEYESVLVSYALDQVSKTTGFLGFADDNYIDGTPSGVFSFVDPSIVALGYGLTTTEIHEQGHHTSMSHPHDGYDFESDTDYEPTGKYYFAWSGDQSNSIMSYIDLNWDFSQFDRDNAARQHAAGYYLTANRVAGDIAASPNAALAAADLALADTSLGLAKLAMANHDYAGTYTNARAAYGHVLTGAAKAGVAVEVSGPGPFTLLDPQKGGVGLDRRKAYMIDLDERANAKRFR